MNFLRDPVTEYPGAVNIFDLTSQQQNFGSIIGTTVMTANMKEEWKTGTINGSADVRTKREAIPVDGFCHCHVSPSLRDESESSVLL